jgi:hypothetical protein
MMPVKDAVASLDGLGYDRIDLIPGSTYKDASTVVVIPTRGMISHRVVQAWQGMLSPMNQRKAVLFCTGDEVGHAYNRMIQNILDNPELATWKYVLTLEDDNLIPPDAHIRLLESIEAGPYDAVSGIYFTKGDTNMPMAYGDPDEFKRTGVLELKPRDIRQPLASGHVMPVNGIAMGCALWRMDLFRTMPAPWFVTCADVIPDKGPQVYTQDLYFCERATRAGRRFAVDMRVRVGHLDINTGVVY